MNKTTSIIKNNVLIYVSDATQITQKSMDVHNTNPLPSLALGTSLAVFSTMGAMKKGIFVSTTVKGNGPIGKIIVEYKGNGDVRALLENPNVVTEYDKEKFNDIPLTIGVGDGGTLNIVYRNNGVNFGGEVALANGDITTDLAYFLDQSEQINSAVVSSVVLDKPNKIKHSRAAIFQMLPKHSEKDVLWVENFLKTNLLSENTIEEYVAKIDGNVLETTSFNWNCSCSKEKMVLAAKTLPSKDIDELIEEQGFVEIGCNFCKEKYQFKEDAFNV